MRIGIDARLMGETGVGRYISNLLKELALIDEKNYYIIFLKKHDYADFKIPNSRFTKALAEVSWHSLTEQLVMPALLIKEKLDLVHVPYFNVPIFYPGKFIVTIHDLTILHFNTGKATTLPWMLYQLRRLGYQLILRIALKRAERIIAVSRATKQEIIDHFKIPKEKIVVTYEGVDLKLKAQKRLINDPYFLYVGNAYPHKNLETLLVAFRKLITYNPSASLRAGPQLTTIKLVLVGKEDYFYRRLKRLVSEKGLTSQVIFFGQAVDTELVNLYQHAVALVFPSLMEGFGLPALEALSLGCPVICSDIPVFREVLGDKVIYFPPDSDKELISKLKMACINYASSKESKRNSKLLSKSFSWNKMAKATLNAYQEAVS